MSRRTVTRMSRGERGFTLIEVLVASLILATALIGLSSLFVLGLKNNAVAREDTVMAALAQEKVEQLRRKTRSDLEDMFIATCRGPCTDSACTNACYPNGCPTADVDSDGTADAYVFDAHESPVSDPNPTDRVKEQMYVRRWHIEKHDLGQPIGCVFKIEVTVGSRNGLFAPAPSTATTWVAADWSEVVGSGNPRRVHVASYRR